MKRLAILTFLIFIAISLNVLAVTDSVTTGIKFEHGSWAEITAKAKQENKPIFLDAFASWCGPCKWMAKNVFPNDTVGEFYNRNFVCAKIDMEKGEGISLAKKFGVKAYPTFLYINSDGELLIHRTCGSTSADIFIENGKDAINPDKQLSAYKRKFENNTPSANEAYKYLEMLSNACMEYDNELTYYFKTQKESELTSPENWKIIFSFLNDPFSREFKYLISHRSEYEKSYSKELVEQKISDVYSAGLSKSLRKDDTKSYEDLKKNIKKSLGKDSEKIILSADMAKFKKSKDWVNYAKAADKFISGYAMNDAELLNKTSWTIYENISDKSILQKAEKWSKHASELNNNYSFNDTYASILYKLGKKSEAKEAAVKAIELAKKENADSKSTEELLSKIEKMN